MDLLKDYDVTVYSSWQAKYILRDEFSGLLDQMTKKDYLSGMAELLTKLYDCKMQKRVLKSGIVEVRNPRLTIYGVELAITLLCPLILNI